MEGATVMPGKERLITEEKHKLAKHETRHLFAAFFAGEKIQGAFLEQQGAMAARVDFDGLIPEKNLLPIVTANITEDLIGRDVYAGDRTKENSDVWLAFDLAKKAGAQSDDDAVLMIRTAINENKNAFSTIDSRVIDRFADIFASDANGTIASHEAFLQYLNQAIQETTQNVSSIVQYVEHTKPPRVGGTTTLLRAQSNEVAIVYRPDDPNDTKANICSCSGSKVHTATCSIRTIPLSL